MPQPTSAEATVRVVFPTPPTVQLSHDTAVEMTTAGIDITTAEERMITEEIPAEPTTQEKETAEKTLADKNKVIMRIPLKRKAPHPSQLLGAMTLEYISPLVDQLSMEEWDAELRHLQVWHFGSAEAIKYLKRRLAEIRKTAQEKKARCTALEKDKQEMEKTSKAALVEKEKELIQSRDNANKMQADYNLAVQQNVHLAGEYKQLEETFFNVLKEKKILEETNAKQAKEMKALEASRDKCKMLQVEEAEITFTNIFEQVQFLNPGANLEGIHYFHFVRDGKRVNMDPDIENI